jgi:hypothetical protein
MDANASPRWLLLLHQIPPQPPYLRVKIWRRLQRLGAVAMRNAVYVLPRTEQALEDFQWVARDIAAEGGEATVCEARLVEGLSDEQVEALFSAARDADYMALAEELRELAARARRRTRREAMAELAADLTRARARQAEIEAIDFFGASGREAVAGLVAEIAGRLGDAAPARDKTEARPRGRTWVTRKGVHVDRIGSAWLIRRFIDPDATFKFVAARGYRPERGELRFDMFEAEYTHEGDRCTFETLCARFGLNDPGLVAVAEIVHDIDVKDGKYGRPETDGVARLIAGLALRLRDDDERLRRGGELFEDLYTSFRKKSKGDGG